MRFLEIKSVEEAKDIIDRHFTLKPSKEIIPVEEGHNRVLAQDIHSSINVPPFDRAIMDGFAVIAEDTFTAEESNPVLLNKIDTLSAGEEREVALKKGCAVSISTGAPIPKGADSIIMVEYTNERPRYIVEIKRAVAPGENIAPLGSDIVSGNLILKENTILTAHHLGILSALGLSEVKVWKKPRVAVFSTGSELVQPGERLRYGQIYDINAHAISGSIRGAGGEPFFLGIIKDSRKEIDSKLKGALKKYKLIITSGGTSKGGSDILADSISDLGKPGVIIHGVNMKPGKPVMVGAVKDKLIFGLPGNPISALMSFHIFVSGLIRRLSKMPEESIRMVEAKAGARIHSVLGRHELKLVGLEKDMSEGQHIAFPVAKGSGAITALSEADGYVEIPPDTGLIEKDDTIAVVML